VWTLSRIGSWQTNHRPTAPTISAPLGEFAELANGGNGTAVVIRVVGGRDVPDCACSPSDVSFGPLGAADSWDSDSHLRDSPFSRAGLRCDTRPHAIEIPTPVRNGRRNRYEVRNDLPLRHPIKRQERVASLIVLVHDKQERGSEGQSRR